MSKRRRPELDPDRLRYVAEQAVAALSNTGLQPPADADTDTLKHWHELQVSQIELDMQSVALAEVQVERDLAEAAREHYAALYDQAPAGYLSLDFDGRITRANRAAGELLSCRRDELPGKTFEQFVAPQAQAGLRRFLAELIASGRRAVLELPLFSAHRDGVMRKLHIEANADIAAGKCRIILTDIGSADAREAARRRAFQVIDSMGEGVLVCGPDKRIVSVNPAFTALTGYSVEEALGRDPGFLGRPGAHPPGYHAEAMRCLRTYGRWQGEVLNRRRDGVPYVAAMSLTVIRDDDGAISHYIGVFSDITARQRAETDLLKLSRELDGRVAARTAELTEANRMLMLEVTERKRTEAALHESREQLRKLAEHLETVKEEERKRIARDIHDELGQNLLALRIDISMLSARTGERHPRLHRRVAAVLENIDTTIRNVRGIMNELRPAVLDLGLQAALEWQTAEFRKRSGMTCALSLPDEATFAAIAPDREIVLFRALQEALSNVWRHARATHVDIALTAWRGWLHFSVTDNGIGIAPGERGKSESFGLIGMAQRVSALGGSFEVGEYQPGVGCKLTIGFDMLDVPDTPQTLPTP
jgi:PAS domain S-box-containing protein